MRPFYRHLFLVAHLILLASLSIGAATPLSPAHAQDRVLRVAWSPQAPYQFYQLRGDSQYVTGIDVVTFRQAADEADLTVVLEELPWEEALSQVEAGKIDAALAAFHTKERDRYGYFSVPLRMSRESVFLPSDLLPQATTLEGLFAALAQEQLRLGVIQGFELGADFADFQNRHPDQVVVLPRIDDLLSSLSSGQIDGFILDRFAGYRELARHDLRGFEAHKVPIYEAPVAALFSRETVEPEVIQRFDTALAKLHARGETKTIGRRFVLPAVMDIALYGSWFEAILIVGMVAFSISAVVIARSGGYGLYGAVVLACLPALGGGVVRDLLILREPYIFAYPIYVYIVLGTLLAGYLFNRLLDRARGRSLLFFDAVNLVLLMRRRMRPQLLMEFFDAAGIAAFTIVAVTVAAEFGRDPLWMWGPLLAALTATGGAILRDMIRADSKNDILHNAFYGETVILWSFPLSLYLQYFGHLSDPETVFWALMISMMGIFATRMIFVLFGWRAPRY